MDFDAKQRRFEYDLKQYKSKTKALKGEKFKKKRK